MAELLGTDTDSEKAIRWLIALMVLTCDPLAIAWTAAASARHDEMSKSKSKSYIRPDDGATMIEVEPHQYVNAKVLRLQGHLPADGQQHDETAVTSARR